MSFADTKSTQSFGRGMERGLSRSSMSADNGRLIFSEGLEIGGSDGLESEIGIWTQSWHEAQNFPSIQTIFTLQKVATLNLQHQTPK